MDWSLECVTVLRTTSNNSFRPLSDQNGTTNEEHQPNDDAQKNYSVQSKPRGLPQPSNQDLHIKDVQMKKLIVCGARHFLVVTSQCAKSLIHCSGMRSQQHREANRGKKSTQCYSFFCLYLHFIHLLQLQGTRPSQVVWPNPGRIVRQVC